MKRIKISFKILITMTLVFILTGCIKSEYNMEIGKDRSLNLVIISAVDESVAGDFQPYAEEIKNLEAKGYYIEDYKENGKVGKKITKKIKNIDDYSTEAKITKEEMSDALTGEKEYMFTVKKGFLKNTYVATYLFNLNEYSNTENQEEFYVPEYDEKCIYNYNNEIYNMSCDIKPVEDQVTNRANYEKYVEAHRKQEETMSEQLQNLTSSMDLKFNLKLPYKAKSNNATTVTDGGKKLVWDLTKTQEVNFEFSLYNMTNVYIVIGIGVVIFLIIVSAFTSTLRKISKPKKPQNPIEEEQQSLFENPTILNSTVEEPTPNEKMETVSIPTTTMPIMNEMDNINNTYQQPQVIEEQAPVITNPNIINSTMMETEEVKPVTLIDNLPNNNNILQQPVQNEVAVTQPVEQSVIQPVNSENSFVNNSAQPVQNNDTSPAPTINIPSFISNENNNNDNNDNNIGQ